jgi:hypothetical protein
LLICSLYHSGRPLSYFPTFEPSFFPTWEGGRKGNDTG